MLFQPVLFLWTGYIIIFIRPLDQSFIWEAELTLGAQHVLWNLYLQVSTGKHFSIFSLGQRRSLSDAVAIFILCLYTLLVVFLTVRFVSPATSAILYLRFVSLLHLPRRLCFGDLVGGRRRGQKMFVEIWIKGQIYKFECHSTCSSIGTSVLNGHHLFFLSFTVKIFLAWTVFSVEMMLINLRSFARFETFCLMLWRTRFFQHYFQPGVTLSRWTTTVLPFLCNYCSWDLLFNQLFFFSDHFKLLMCKQH